MDRDLVALLGFVGMFALMALRVPIGVAMMGTAAALDVSLPMVAGAVIAPMLGNPKISSSIFKQLLKRVIRVWHPGIR